MDSAWKRWSGQTGARWVAPALAALGLAAILGSTGPTVLWAETFSLGYQVAWGHLTLAEGEMSYSEAEARYRVRSSGHTEGLLALFFPWHGRAETAGLLEEAGRRPLVHQHQGTRKEMTRWTRVDWAAGDTPRTETKPPPDLTKVTSLPDATTLDTSDPFTVLLTVLDRLASGGRCEAEARVWDGRRRYDLSVTHLGEETLAADRPWAYGGPAIACALEVEQIGGFWRKKPGWREGGEALRLGRVVWAAELRPGRWVLVRAELETAYGTVVGRLLPEAGPGEEEALTD